MRINEVCSLTGLTKKAINYYEDQGLVKPIKDSNGYRNYSKTEVVLLNEISLYRKLDISIKEIKLIISSSDKKKVLNKIITDKHKKLIEIKVHNIYLEKLVESDFKEEEIRVLNERIINEEKDNGEFIKKELKRAFPSGLGLFISNHFSVYLNGPLDTLEKYNAWINIVDFLDNVPNIKIPKSIQLYYESINDEVAQKISNSTRKRVIEILNAEGEELEKHKKEILESMEKQNEKSMLKIMNPINKFKKQMYEFFNSSGYYDIFIPNMKILSKEYKEYHDKLMALNDKLSRELGIKYDENMRVVKVSE